MELLTGAVRFSMPNRSERWQNVSLGLQQAAAGITRMKRSKNSIKIVITINNTRHMLSSFRYTWLRMRLMIYWEHEDIGGSKNSISALKNTDMNYYKDRFVLGCWRSFNKCTSCVGKQPPNFHLVSNVFQGKLPTRHTDLSRKSI